MTIQVNALVAVTAASNTLLVEEMMEDIVVLLAMTATLVVEVDHVSNYFNLNL